MIEQGPAIGLNQNLNSYKKRAFELCLAIYRVTNLIPKGEVLGGQMRQSSSLIAVFLATGKIRDTILKVEEIKIYLEIAKNQKWLAPINFDILQSAYNLLSDALSSQGSDSQERVEKKRRLPCPGKKRKKKWDLFLMKPGIVKKKIVEYFNKNKEARVTDLMTILGKISERTVRNDLAVLIGKNMIRRVGGRKGAKYLLNMES